MVDKMEKGNDIKNNEYYMVVPAVCHLEAEKELMASDLERQISTSRHWDNLM